jgi:hypothetical protein
MMMMDLQTRSITGTIPARIITLAWKMTILVIHTATGVEPKRFGKRLWHMAYRYGFQRNNKGGKNNVEGGDPRACFEYFVHKNGDAMLEV